MNYEIVNNNIINITSIKKINEDGSVWWIPIDENNSDYQEYLAWVKESSSI